MIEFRDENIHYNPGELIYIPANIEHKIIAG